MYKCMHVQVNIHFGDIIPTGYGRRIHNISMQVYSECKIDVKTSSLLQNMLATLVDLNSGCTLWAAYQLHNW